MKNSMLLFTVLFVLAPGLGLAQPQAAQDPLAEHLFPPELLMQHQKVIGLTESQRTFIKTEFMDIQWQLQSEMEAMASLLKEEKSDEQQVLTQLEKILGLERDMKRAQLSLILRIKNQLSAEQQAKLRKIQEKEREERKG
jgi:hypothetical protein